MDSSKINSNLSSQCFNDKKGLRCKPIEPPHNFHNKYVSVANNLLCTHFEHNGHLKGNCKKRKRDKEGHMKFQSENNQEEKEWRLGSHAKSVRSESKMEMVCKGPGPRYSFSKTTFPPLSGRFLVIPFDNY